MKPLDVEAAFRAAVKERADALLVLASPSLNSQRKKIAVLAAKAGLPAIYPNLEYVEDGGLMAYAVSYLDLCYRAAAYVDKILKGRKPADLPIELPMKFELLVNLNTAKQIGVTIEPNVLARAEKKHSLRQAARRAAAQNEHQRRA